MTIGKFMFALSDQFKFRFISKLFLAYTYIFFKYFLMPENKIIIIVYF